MDGFATRGKTERADGDLARVGLAPLLFLGAGVAGAPQPTMAAGNAVPAGVPLPRARPAAAPEAASTDTSDDLVPSFNIEQTH